MQQSESHPLGQLAYRLTCQVRKAEPSRRLPSVARQRCIFSRSTCCSLVNAAQLASVLAAP